MIIQESSSGQWWSAGRSGNPNPRICFLPENSAPSKLALNGREANYGWLLALVFEFGTWVGRFCLLTRARAFEQECFAQKQKVKWAKGEEWGQEARARGLVYDGEFEAWAESSYHYEPRGPRRGNRQCVYCLMLVVPLCRVNVLIRTRTTMWSECLNT